MSSTSSTFVSFGCADVYESDMALLSSPTSWWTDRLLLAHFELLQRGDVEGVDPARHRFVAPETAFLLLHTEGQRQPSHCTPHLPPR